MYSITDLSAEFGVHENTIRKLIRQKLVSPKLVRGRRRVKKYMFDIEQVYNLWVALFSRGLIRGNID